MRDAKKQQKHELISKAAYDLLETKGYGGTSMLSIAKAAKASNETLYRWYGDKHGLFMALVKDNADLIKNALLSANALGEDPQTTVDQVAPLLLTMLLGERAIALNRAAAADPTGDLGRAISSQGREVVQPLITKLMGQIGYHDPTVAAQTFLSLLIGDQQIKRVTGVMPCPSDAEIHDRCLFAKRAMPTVLAAIRL